MTKDPSPAPGIGRGHCKLHMRCAGTLQCEAELLACSYCVTIIPTLCPRWLRKGLLGIPTCCLVAYKLECIS